MLFNAVKKLRKRDRCRGFDEQLSLLRNDFDKFNYGGANMLDFIY